MTDAAVDTPTAEPAADPAPAPAAEPASAPETPPSPAPSGPPAGEGDDPFADLPADQAVFDRGYVDKLRREGARYRTEARDFSDQAKTYNDVFGVYDEADRQVWLDLAQQWASDPAAAAAVMRQISNAVLDEGGDVAAEPADPATPDAGTGPLTAEKVQEMMAAELSRRDQEARQQAEVDNIYAEMRTAGFDPKSRDGFSILWIANNETNGDIAKAIETFKADRQKVIDEYVAGRSAGGRAQPAPNNGVVASAHTPIKNLDDARAAADEFIRSQVGGSS